MREIRSEIKLVRIEGRSMFSASKSAPTREHSIIGKRTTIVGNRNAREVVIINTHRGERNASASWNPGKGLFSDKGDPSYNGDIINFVMRCHDVVFAEAVRIVANEAGVDVPYLNGKASRRPGSPRRTKSNGEGQPHREPEAQRQGARDKAGSARDEEESPDQRIERAQKVWQGAGPILDTPGEAYLNARKITLDREEPWLRFDPFHPLHVRMVGWRNCLSTGGPLPDLDMRSHDWGEKDKYGRLRRLFLKALTTGP